MDWEKLTQKEKDLVYKSLVATSKGSFFEDWEFQTLMGFNREELNFYIKDFENVDKNSKESELFITNCLVHLLSYPHNSDEELESYIGSNKNELKDILQKIK